MATNLEELGREIKVVQWRQYRSLDRRLRELGTTLPQWDVLRAIANRPGASAHELAEATFQSDQAFGTMATRLEAKGLIMRSAGHGRRVDHRLSATGEEIVSAGRQIALRVFSESFAGLSEAERGRLLRVLRQVGGRLAALDET
jgi:DNA-binding MarR family transcriptional regulator